LTALQDIYKVQLMVDGEVLTWYGEVDVLNDIRGIMDNK
jgi:hypothetical protein